MVIRIKEILVFVFVDEFIAVYLFAAFGFIDGYCAVDTVGVAFCYIVATTIHINAGISECTTG